MGTKTLCEEKMEDFLQTMHKIRHEYSEKGKNITTKSVINIAAKQPAKKFYISTEEAIRNINKIIKGERLKVTSDEKKQMYYDIYNKYIEQTNSCEVKEYKYSVIERILNSPAPKFYINPLFADQQIRYYYHRKKRQSKFLK